jgi:hypothetical protein
MTKSFTKSSRTSFSDRQPSPHCVRDVGALRQHPQTALLVPTSSVSGTPTTQRSLQAAIEFLSCATRFGYAVTNIPSPISLLYGRWRARLGDVCMETSVHPLKPSSENAVQPMCTCYLYIIISSRLSYLLHTVEHLQEDATKACELEPKLSK